MSLISYRLRKSRKKIFPRFLPLGWFGKAELDRGWGVKERLSGRVLRVK